MSPGLHLLRIARTSFLIYIPGAGAFFFAAQDLITSSDFRCFPWNLQMIRLERRYSESTSAHPILPGNSYLAIFFLCQYLGLGHFALFFSFQRSNPWRTYSGLSPKVSQIFLKEKIQSLPLSKIHSSASVKSLLALLCWDKRWFW